MSMKLRFKLGQALLQSNRKMTRITTQRFTYKRMRPTSRAAPRHGATLVHWKHPWISQLERLRQETDCCGGREIMMGIVLDSYG